MIISVLVCTFIDSGQLQLSYIKLKSERENTSELTYQLNITADGLNMSNVDWSRCSTELRESDNYFSQIYIASNSSENCYESNGRFGAVEISGDVTEHKKSGILKTSLNINGVDVFKYILCTVLVGI